MFFLCNKLEVLSLKGVCVNSCVSSFTCVRNDILKTHLFLISNQKLAFLRLLEWTRSHVWWDFTDKDGIAKKDQVNSTCMQITKNHKCL